MTIRKTPLVTGEIYHLYNRGVDKRIIFNTNSEFARFLDTTLYYQNFRRQRYSWHKSLALKQIDDLKNPLVQLLGFSLIPNHFHLVVRQTIDCGISNFMHNIGTSYTNFFNTKYYRSGSLFQGSFQSVHIKTDEQLIHVIRYVHLNSVVANLVSRPEDWPWSSHQDYLGIRTPALIDTKEILSYFSSTDDITKKVNNYKKFVDDQIAYAKELEKIKRDLKDENKS